MQFEMRYSYNIIKIKKKCILNITKFFQNGKIPLIVLQSLQFINWKPIELHRSQNNCNFKFIADITKLHLQSGA